MLGKALFVVLLIRIMRASLPDFHPRYYSHKNSQSAIPEKGGARISHRPVLAVAGDIAAWASLTRRVGGGNLTCGLSQNEVGAS